MLVSLTVHKAICSHMNLKLVLSKESNKIWREKKYTLYKYSKPEVQIMIWYHPGSSSILLGQNTDCLVKDQSRNSFWKRRNVKSNLERLIIQLEFPNMKGHFALVLISIFNSGCGLRIVSQCSASLYRNVFQLVSAD